MSKVTFSLANLDNYNNIENVQSCRFIGSRNQMSRHELDSPRLNIQHKNMPSLEEINDENVFYKKVLKKNLQEETPNKMQTFTELTLNQNIISIPSLKKKLTHRHIEKTPFKVLDAPFLQDDYYLNVVDWSQQDNLAVGLGNAVYMWNYFTNKIEKVMANDEQNFVSCVTWNLKNELLAIGSMSGAVTIHDVTTMKEVVRLEDHIERVGALSFNENLLLTGSRDNCVFLYDLRTPQKPQHYYEFHTQEVCGIKWSPEGDYFASGGNDNKLFVFSIKIPIPLFKKNHKAAVKALGWSPLKRGILATGAGTADRCLRVWDMNKKQLVQCKDTGSQICNLVFSKQSDEIITAHGFSENDVCVWQTNGLKKIASLKSHQQRVLYLAINKDGSYIVSGAGDETLRFWNLGHDKCKEQATPAPQSFLPSALRQFNFSS